MDAKVIPDTSSNSVPSGVSELPYPKGYDSDCTGCRLLCDAYGPEDGELLNHLANDHIDPDFDFPAASYEEVIAGIGHEISGR
jgi:hypothetical protein